MKEPSKIIPCPLPTHKGFHDLTGKRFGRFVVISYAGMIRTPGDGARHYWWCVCDCGGSSRVRHYSLVSGRTQSCGCISSEAAIKRNWKHGQTDTPEYWIWCGMIKRCTYAKDNAYRFYGALGIKVAEEWRGPEGFVAFLRHVGPRPSPQHSIDRFPNQKGNYEPGNVRWATMKEQQRNRKSNRMITLHGKTKSLIEWIESGGTVSRGTFYKRVRNGLSVERALTEPIQVRSINVRATVAT